MSDSFSNYDAKMKCPITNKDMIDDCHITIEFGYGSDKDMTTYTFSPVHDEVGKNILKLIQSRLPEGKSVEDFGRDVLAETFDPNWRPTDEQRKEWGFDPEGE